MQFSSVLFHKFEHFGFPNLVRRERLSDRRPETDRSAGPRKEWQGGWGGYYCHAFHLCVPMETQPFGERSCPRTILGPDSATIGILTEGWSAVSEDLAQVARLSSCPVSYSYACVDIALHGVGSLFTMFSFHCCLFPLSSRRPVTFYGSICAATTAMAMLKPGLGDGLQKKERPSPRFQ